MAAHERSLFHAPNLAADGLREQLAKILIAGTAFKLYHLSTPPSRCAALYSAPPGQRPLRTYCESHFLAASIDVAPSSTAADDGENQGSEVLVFALEVLIYSTAYSTTFFVSKADSTGYLHLLKLPKGSPSPLRDISATFLSWLVARRKRPGVRSVVSLFARAQGQYLFPGSVDNEGKHVLDDRGLIRWWCRVLDLIVGGAGKFSEEESWKSVRGYLKVPGLDDHDIRSYLPRSKDASERTLWSIGHPLRELAGYDTDVPPRCVVPRFPDDPKSRFLEELDDELSASQDKAASGDWRSVKTLDQFWEMMAFRQECSAGRLVGFIWVVFEPVSRAQYDNSTPPASQSTITSTTGDLLGDDKSVGGFGNGSIPNNSFPPSSPPSTQSSPTKKRPRPPKKVRLTGPIHPRPPRIKTHIRHPTSSSAATAVPESTPYYIWPVSGRGHIVLAAKEYTRATELLLHLEFKDLELAVGSTTRWCGEVKGVGGGEREGDWGEEVKGTKVMPGLEKRAAEGGVGGVRTLNVGLVRKKRKVVDGEG